MLFDVRLRGDFDGQITYFQPVLAPLPLEQAVFELGKLYICRSFIVLEDCLRRSQSCIIM